MKRTVRASFYSPRRGPRIRPSPRLGERGAGPAASSGRRCRAAVAEEMAIASYNSGIEHKDKGIKIEASAAAITDPKERTRRTTRRRRNTRRRSRTSRARPRTIAEMYQAYNGMGFSYARPATT